MGVIELLLLPEVIVKDPRLGRGARVAGQSFFHNLFRRRKVLFQQVTGGDKRVPNVVHVTGHLVAGKVASGVEHQHVEMEQVAHRVQIFAAVEAAKNGLAAGAIAFGRGGLESGRERVDDRFTAGDVRLGSAGRRHLAGVQLVKHVFDEDVRGLVRDRQAQLVETPLRHLHFFAMARLAMRFQKRLDFRLRENRRGKQRGEANHNQAGSRPASLPELMPKRSDLTPKRCNILT